MIRGGRGSGEWFVVRGRRRRRVLRLETTRTTGKNNFERGARANSPAHLIHLFPLDIDMVASF